MSNTIQDNLIRLNSAKTSIANAIVAKGGTVGESDGFEDFPNDIASIPEGGGSSVAEKDVNFYDYDGSIVTSYTATEFAELSAMPDNPTHEGLTAQGWNWSLADAKTYVAKYGILNVGQIYITTDGTTKVYVTLPSDKLSNTVGICVDGTADIDWGDNSEHSTLTGTSTTTLVTASHTYSNAGDYVISIDVTGSFAFGNTANNCVLVNNRDYITKVYIGANITSINFRAFRGCTSLYYISIPNNITIFDASSGIMTPFSNCKSLYHINLPTNITNICPFDGCYNLHSITISNNLMSFDKFNFNDCYSLMHISIPEGITTVDNFDNCYSLKRITIPDTVTTIYGSCFYQCYSLKHIIITENINATLGYSVVTNCYALESFTVPIGMSFATGASNYIFSNTTSLKYIKFLSSTPPPKTGSYALCNNLPKTCIIYVPQGSLSAYTSASNYPSPTSYNYVEY